MHMHTDRVERNFSQISRLKDIALHCTSPWIPHLVRKDQMQVQGGFAKALDLRFRVN